MNIEEMQKEENFEHEVLDRLKCLDTMDFDYNAVDGSYVDAVLKARDIILTAYEKEKEKNSKLLEALDSVWLDGFEDGKKYFENKIKAKIEELEKGNKSTFIRGEKILVLQSILKRSNNV